MTLVLELSPEVEAQLAQAAKSQGQAVEDFALDALLQRAGRLNRSKSDQSSALDLLQGLCAGDGRTVNDFLSERHTEGQSEFKEWEARKKAAP